MMVMVFLNFFMFLFFNKFYNSLMMMMMSFLILLYFNKFNNYIDINEIFGIHMYSYMLLMLVFWILGLVLMFMKIKIKDILFMKYLYMYLLMSLIIVFMSMNLLLFYMMFEFSLILIFFLIMKFGLGEMRKLASFYLLYYTMFFSLPFLIFIMLIFKYFYSLNMFYLEFLSLMFMSNYMFIYFMMTLFVKIPMFLLHFWLLKAHVEASVSGSMILASILLKLGVYGLMRMMLIFKINMMYFIKLILYLSIFGSIFISILCLRQIDMKILVAYSSVVHMGLLLSSLMNYLNLGFKGAYLMMISHGLCSSGLFFLVNLCYKMSNSRLMLMNKGLINIYPSMSLMWFLLCSSNLAAPLSLNLISEMMLIMNLMNWNIMLFIFLIILMFFSFLYSLNLFSYTQHGEFNLFQKIMNFKLIDYFILIMHWLPLNLMILNLNIFM